MYSPSSDTNSMSLSSWYTSASPIPSPYIVC
uniref:Uncharacterized protein n=1 Tax=Arundo donax TaxID=35708 RepID=A0A0A9B9K2_ARUDO